MKSINPTNVSEQQVLEFVEAFEIDVEDGTFLLRPQGDNTIIEKEAINLMIINVNNKRYSFGGISEKFYNEVVNYFIK